eukprot:CAMPEP_0206140744 /NCGR_PEP_ID=MMETSP1473-20131121/10524_1 /ASSEMBLY_ACC=CAM_ASM_001109 /TAXON_ID=1461547 /ORGANISM="Stichococcus sp, Strain RCC1054" /LENGTH=711 /DNA_ID=CAMNT_0053535011 /DNA_START=336 /DNA_END=2471 /DNA_ORIENTATION=+
MGKDKDKKKSKDKDKKRKRDKDEDEARKRAKAERLARKITEHRKKELMTGDAPAAPFVWTKKIEKDIVEGASVKNFSKRAEREKHEERMAEIEKVQRRREEREAEKIRSEEELQFIQRERAVAEGRELDKKEELFHLEQAKARTRQRLAEGRPKPVDIIVQTLYFPDEFEADADADPYTVMRGLTLAELRELRADVEDYQELDRYEDDHIQYWEAMAMVSEHELAEAERQEDLDRARLRGEHTAAAARRRDAGWHASIDADMSSMFAGKTLDELRKLEDQISDQLDDESTADPEYWSASLRSLRIWKARARLRELHANILARQLAQADAAVDVRAEMGWDREDREEAEAAEEPANDATSPAAAAAHKTAADPSEKEPPAPETAEAADVHPASVPEEPATSEDEDAALERLAGTDAAGASGAAAEAQRWSGSDSDSETEENVGQWSPPPVDPAMIGVGQDVVHEDDDRRILDLLRAQVKKKSAAKLGMAAAAASTRGDSEAADDSYRQMVSGQQGIHPMMRNLTDVAPRVGEQGFRSGVHSKVPDADSPAEAAFRAAAARQMGSAEEAGDVAFGGEVALDSQVYWWHEKYRPRKPKYFNRVHTGYEWNKYNQTHYDHDNPPPKTVQGYKFNIFFPDLIDKQQAPTYECAPDPQSQNGQTCLLRFHAGPPYEDIAFRIVSKEWEYSHKRGFKSVFERGILHLYFNFKRARYRR